MEMSGLKLEPHIYGLMLSMTIQGFYITLLSKAYTHGDMSQVYPFMRGLGAMLTSLCDLVLFHEHLSARVIWALASLSFRCLLCQV